jgi:hypothetical protein
MTNAKCICNMMLLKGLCRKNREYIYNIRTLSVNIKFICTSFRNRQNSEPSTMYVYCVYPAMSKKSENLSDLNKKDRNKRHSSPFINVVKGVFFVVNVTLVPVSYLSALSADKYAIRINFCFIRTRRINFSYYTNKLFSLQINFPGTL